MAERILVASDGSEESQGALRLAYLLAQEQGFEVEVVSIYEPLQQYPDVEAGALPTPSFDHEQSELHKERLKSLLVQLGEGTSAWTLHWAIGSAPQGIAEQAGRGDYQYLLMGVGKHGRVDRWFRTETSLHVLRHVNLPVLAIQSAATSLPARVLIAIDFSEFSYRAARTVVGVLAKGADVMIVHARGQGDLFDPSDKERANTYDVGARARLEELARELQQERPDIECSTHLLGEWKLKDPGSAILAFAEEHEVDLIATGSHGAGFLGHLLLGSVSTQVLRGANCSVLIVPSEAEEVVAEAEGDAHGERTVANEISSIEEVERLEGRAS